MHTHVHLIHIASSKRREGTSCPYIKKSHAACHRRTVICLCVVQSITPKPLDVLQWILISLKDALLDKLLRVRPVLQPLLKAISPHVVFELPLLLLQGRCSIRGWQDVSLDEIIAVGASIEALLEVVGCTLALELKSFGLQGTRV